MTGYGKNSPVRALLQNQVIVIQGQYKPKAIICGIFFVMEVSRCGVLAVAFNRSWLTVSRHIEKTLIEVSFPAFLSSP